VFFFLINVTIDVVREIKEFQMHFVLRSLFATVAQTEKNQMKTLPLVQSKTIFPYDHNTCICLIYWSEMYYAERSIYCGRM